MLVIALLLIGLDLRLGLLWADRVRIHPVLGEEVGADHRLRLLLLTEHLVLGDDLN